MTLATYRWSGLDAAARAALLRRPAQDDSAALAARVESIVADVRARGDAALAELTERYDGVTLETLQVGEIGRAVV